MKTKISLELDQKIIDSLSSLQQDLWINQNLCYSLDEVANQTLAIALEPYPFNKMIVSKIKELKN